MRLVAAVLASALALSACGGSAPRQLLPDLDQAVPQAVSLRVHGPRTWLVFASAVDNVGAGPLVVAARRSPGKETMAAVQVVSRSDGSTEAVPLRAVLRFQEEKTHHHWHLLGFERYELRRASDGTLVAPGHKIGFCLGDRYDTAPGTLPSEPADPVWTEECGRGHPDLLVLREGISVGWGDDYVPELEGQYVDVTRLPPGRYVLVHRVNANHALLESDYRNDAASVLVELDHSGVRVLASCPDSARCPGT